MVYENKLQTIKEAKTAVFEYIEIWYNRKRLHSSLGYRTPQEMETYLLNIKLAA
ncbi:IS3 family transposase [Rhodocytophaga rosea]|uniref:IS3 family transposase n=1 Tax=Rhodocytophaga rosea TaxID=2704465 RepID=UPI003742E22D